MQITEKIKSIGKLFCGLCGSAYKDLETTLNDYARMSEADSKIISISNVAFCRCFSDVAKRISYANARADKNADTYCLLADKAVEMLKSGTSEADTLSYFDELLRKEIERR